jgi:hypothetical protein
LRTSAGLRCSFGIKILEFFMIEETKAQDGGNAVETTRRAVSGEQVVGYAILGCLAAGTIGIYKAAVTDGIESASCLVASVIAFGTVCYLYFRRD